MIALGTVGDQPAVVSLGDGERGAAPEQPVQPSASGGSPVDVVARHPDEVRPADDRVGPRGDVAHRLAASSSPRSPCQPTATIASDAGRPPRRAAARRRPGPGSSPGRPPRHRDRRRPASDRRGRRTLEPALGPLDVDEDRTVLEENEVDVDARFAQQIELGLTVDASLSTR